MKELLDCKTIDETLKAAWKMLQRKKHHSLSSDEILHLFRICDAYWVHGGKTEDPHAKLTTGMCSNGFFDTLRVLKYTLFSDLLAREMARQLVHEIFLEGLHEPEWIIGSPMAAITFAHDVARELGVPISMFLEKDSTNPKKLTWNRMTIPKNAWVLQIEELVTTSRTLIEGKRAIEEGNSQPVNFIPIVGILVHRPPKLPVKNYEDRKVVALIEKEIWAVPPEECELCRQGSEPIRPKQNWSKLTGRA
jgi:orotate phosphoribosyltransferase